MFCARIEPPAPGLQQPASEDWHHGPRPHDTSQQPAVRGKERKAAQPERLEHVLSLELEAERHRLRVAGSMAARGARLGLGRKSVCAGPGASPLAIPNPQPPPRAHAPAS